MQRHALLISYDGAAFVGWQRQRHALGVQQALETAIRALCGVDLEVHAAGRTDAGVHALTQPVHVDLPVAYAPAVLCAALNAHLPPTCRVLQAASVPDTFHARFSAVERRYRYRVLNRRAACPLRAGRVLHVAFPLDGAAMRTAATYFIGQHDFAAFRAVGCTARSSLRTMDAVRVRALDDEVVFDIAARAFLYRQVRSMVGTLVHIGRGKQPPEHVQRALASGDRRDCGPVAHAHGLYFCGARYDDAALPEFLRSWPVNSLEPHHESAFS